MPNIDLWHGDAALYSDPGRKCCRCSGLCQRWKHLLIGSAALISYRERGASTRQQGVHSFPDHQLVRAVRRRRPPAGVDQSIPARRSSGAMSPLSGSGLSVGQQASFGCGCIPAPCGPGYDGRVRQDGSGQRHGRLAPQYPSPPLRPALSGWPYHLSHCCWHRGISLTLQQLSLSSHSRSPRFRWPANRITKMGINDQTQAESKLASIRRKRANKTVWRRSSDESRFGAAFAGKEKADSQRRFQRLASIVLIPVVGGNGRKTISEGK